MQQNDSASDVMRADMRLLEEHEAEALEAALIEWEQSGDFRLFDFDAFTTRKCSECAEKQTTEKKQ
ncbi:MAG: type II toxin-antitoxin system ParD family antitoxin [Gallionellaceae bacterium]|jgi:antitoxin ParD1/3/4|nr:type II toxin-antitoxin system ParD family antitoxin [Gallionellaceae bacterium]